MESNDTTTPFVNPPNEQRGGFIEGISHRYPFSEEMIARYEDQWDWNRLSRNGSLPWSEELIARFENHWDWEELSWNEALPWSEELIARYEDRWEWEGHGSLSTNEALPWSEELIARFESQWDWKMLSSNESLPWSEELISYYEDQWDWERLSEREDIPWCKELIAKFGVYTNRWDWKRLSRREALPWSEELIARFESQWDWRELSKNESLPWSEELIARYEDRWDWERLSWNHSLPWSEELIARYEDRWDWEQLSENEALPWSEELIARYEDRWEWSGRNSLITNEALPWSEELIARYEDRWEWEGRGSLSENGALPWSEELIARYEDRWEWDGYRSLSNNEALPWSEELIARFEDRWEWSRLPSEALTRFTPDDIRQIMSNEQPEKQSEQTEPASGDSHSGHSQKLEDAEVETASRFSLEPEALAQKRLEVSVQLMASAAHYIAGKGGLSDPERERASSPPVSTSELNDLLLKGNPEPEDVVRSVTESASGDALQEQLSEALETVEADSVDIDAIETLFEDAEALNGFLPLVVNARGTEEEERAAMTELIEQHDLDVEVEAHEDNDSLYEAFSEAADEKFGLPFHGELAHALIGYLVYVGYDPSEGELPEDKEDAIEEVARASGMGFMEILSAMMSAEMKADLQSESF